MECNRDEAIRSKVLAETKFLQRDFIGARKFAHKAKQLYPELEGISPFISVLDVHIVAQNKLPGGETNWYAILEVDPVADENIIRKQYRKLALLLHPDKNKSVGAEAAFQHISEAWTILSNKSRKAAYDERCQSKMPSSPCQSSQSTGIPGRPPPQNPPPFMQSFPRQTQAQAPPPPEAVVARAPLAPRQPPPILRPPPFATSFWTSCPSCKMQLEYQRMYLLKSLCCPVCGKPFLAQEILVVGGTLLWPPAPKQPIHRENGYVPTQTTSGSFPTPQFENFPFGNANLGQAVPPMPNDNRPTPETLERTRKPTPEIQMQVEERILGAQAKFKKQSTELQGVKSSERRQKVPKKSLKEELKARAAAHAKEVFDRLIARSKGVIEQKLLVEKERKERAESILKPDQTSACSSSKGTASNNSNGHSKGNTYPQVNRNSTEKNEGQSPGRGSKLLRGKRTAATLDHDLQEVLPCIKKLKEEPDAMLNEQSVTRDEKEVKDNKANQASPRKFTQTGNAEYTKQAVATDLNAMPAVHDALTVPDAEKEVKDNKASQASPRKFTQTGNAEYTKQAVAMDLNAMPEVHDTVPDAAFYEFDKDRTENHFSAGQIWAAYDDGDGMPRSYARVNKVISWQPFKLQIAWLEARSSSDEAVAPLDSGFSLACGDFRLGKALINEHINMYSHVMKFEKGQRRGFKIYPQRGDIWALFKDWDRLKTRDEKTEYIMVEILTDFKNGEGVQVCQFAKLDGFKTLFQRQLGEEHMEWVQSSEMRRFSHQVPAHRLTSEQVPDGITEDCWELDPASTPLELISGTLHRADKG